MYHKDRNVKRVIKFNIAIIDADLIGRKKHRFPNLACMKLSGYYKDEGNKVTLITDYRQLFSRYIELHRDQEPNFQLLMLDDTTNKPYVRYYQEQDIIFDKIIISKVFTDTPVPLQIKHLDICEYGGTGFFYDKAEPLPDYIEHHKPDYHLYDEWLSGMQRKGKEFQYYTDYSIGFTTRGCFRGCEFCVNKNYKSVKLHSPIEEFIDEDRKYICLLDDNILGCSKWKSVVEKLQATGKSFEFKQGMDLRLMTKEKAEVLSKSKYRGDYIFAFDNIEDREQIIEKLRLWRQYCNKTSKFYVFCGFDRNHKWDNDFWVQDIEDTFERIKILMRFECLTYIMRFKKYESSPYAGTYINLARWCNQPNFYKKMSYREFCIKNGENSSTMRYFNKLETDHPEIAKRYYDMKFPNKKEDNVKNIQAENAVI